MNPLFELVQEETFTFTPDDSTEPITIRSGELRKWLLASVMDKVIPLTFPDGETEDDLIKHHGLEQDRMASMTEEEAKEPVIVGLWPGGTHVLIDGAHRRWFWHKRGINVIKGWAVPMEVWQHFLLDTSDMLVVKHYDDGALLPQRRSKGTEK